MARRAVAAVCLSRDAAAVAMFSQLMAPPPPPPTANYSDYLILSKILSLIPPPPAHRWEWGRPTPATAPANSRWAAEPAGPGVSAVYFRQAESFAIAAFRPVVFAP